MKSLTVATVALCALLACTVMLAWPRERLPQRPPLPQLFQAANSHVCVDQDPCNTLPQSLAETQEAPIALVDVPEAPPAVRKVAPRPAAPLNCAWSWRDDDPGRFYLYHSGTQIGAWDVAEGYYRSYDGENWGPRSETLQLTSAAQGERTSRFQPTRPAVGPMTPEMSSYSGSGCAGGSCGLGGRLRARRR